MPAASPSPPPPALFSHALHPPLPPSPPVSSQSFEEPSLLLPAMPEGFDISVEQQHALLTFLTTTPLLHRPALPSITAAQLALLLAASSLSLPACLGHLYALVDARRHFPSVPHIAHAIVVAIRDQSYVSEQERDLITAFLHSAHCALLPPAPAPGRSLLSAGDLLDRAFAECHFNVATFVGFCQRYDTAGVRFDSARALCADIAGQKRPDVTLDAAVFQSILTFLHMPATLTLFSSPPALSLLTPSSSDLTWLMFEGNGLEGTQAALMRFISMHRQFASLSDMWGAVHILWRFNLSSLCEMRTALYDHVTVACEGLLRTANLGHAELEQLLVAGRGLHRTKAHCSRLHARHCTFVSVPDLARAFFANLSASPDEQRLVHAQLAQPSWQLFGAQDGEIIASISPLQCAWLLYEASSVPALQSHLSSFARFRRTFSNFYELLGALQLAVLSQSYSAPFALVSLISFLLSSPTLLAPTVPLYSLTGRQYDTILLTYPLSPLLMHLAQLHALQRSFSSVHELCSALHVAFTQGYHSSEEMRRTLHGYLSSTECDLFDSVQDDQMDATLDVMIEVSGSLPLCFHHLQQLHMLDMRFAQPVKVIPAIRSAVSTGAYSSKAMITALLAYLTSPECSLLSLNAASSLSSLSPSTVDQLLLAGGGLLNTIKHLTRLNLAQQQLPSFAHLISCVRIARRRRLYYSSEQRHQLYHYITSPSCHLFDGLASQVRVSERDMERLFRYGGGVDGTMRTLEELNAKNKRFKSFHHVMAIVKTFATYDAKVREYERERSRRREVAPAERQEVVAYLRSPQCSLFSEHAQALRVTAQEVDAVVLIASSSASALVALRQLNEQGRKFLSMADLSAAIAALIGPNGVITLSKAQRAALLSALSYPQAAIFAGSPSIRLGESDLRSLVYCAGSVERVVAEVAAFDAVGRRFAGFVEFRAALQLSVESGLHARDEERAMLREVLLGASSSHQLFGANRSHAMRGDEGELESLIIAGRGFLTALYLLQYLEETLQRFDSLPSLLAALSSLAQSMVIPPAFTAVPPSSLEDRHRLFALLSSPSSQLFIDASDESDLVITPLAFDLFLARCGGLHRAVRVVMGLERMERRFLSFGELIFTTCRVHDGGVAIKELEEYELGQPDGDDDPRGEEEEEEAEDEEEEGAGQAMEANKADRGNTHDARGKRLDEEKKGETKAMEKPGIVVH